MRICPLPTETVSLLGSPLVYSSPVAVVKELIDNALDALATSIEVVVSQNTVDSVEVRDNGHGIHQADFNSLGRRGCTSKLLRFEDIQNIGGSTLGFRGDALACATNVSTLQIITRTAEEPTASKLFFSEKGGVTKTERVAAPVGTTVQVTDLFSKLPVRRQVALKEASRTLSKITDLLHSYAFARPQVRLTLKVPNRPQAFWSYAPGPHGNLKQAALQVFGADLVSQCVERSSKTVHDVGAAPTHGRIGTSKVEGEDVYTIDALLPKSGADLAKISKGAWFSVDSRPVSFSKGTIHTLHAAFKARFRMTLDTDRTATSFKNTFLAVNIICPPQSYDPNVEPAKDEMLFASSHQLVDTFVRFLGDAYPITPPLHSGPSADVDSRLAGASFNQEIRAEESHERGPQLLSPKHIVDDTPPSTSLTGTDTSVNALIRGVSGTGRAEPQQHPVSPRITTSEIPKTGQASTVSYYKSPPSSGGPQTGMMSDRRASVVAGSASDRTHPASRGWKVDVSCQVDDNDKDRRHVINFCPHSRNEHDPQDTEDDPTQPLQAVNPWILAKSRAARSRQLSLVPNPAPQMPRTRNLPPSASFEIDPPGAQHAHEMRPVVRLDVERPFPQHIAGSITSGRLPPFGGYGDGYRSPMSSSAVGDSGAAQGMQRHVTNRQVLRNSPSFIRHEGRVPRPKQGGIRHPSAEDDQENNWFQKPPDSSSGVNKRQQRRKPRGSDSLNVDQQPQAVASRQKLDVNLDLGAIRCRQVLAENKRLRAPLGGWLNYPDTGSAEAAVSVVQAAIRPAQARPDVLNGTAGVKTGLSSEDPRAYLMQKECTLPATTPRKLRRVKSCMLPLETTPAGQETYKLMQTLHVDMQELCHSVREHSGQRVTDALVDAALISRMDEIVLRKTCHRVKELLSKLGSGVHNGCQIEFNIPGAAKAITAGL